jgi:hypothetical protein
MLLSKQEASRLIVSACCGIVHPGAMSLSNQSIERGKKTITTKIRI